MTSDPSQPHLRLVVENDPQAFARRRAADELSQALRQLTANLMRLTRGSGKGDDIAGQCIAVLDAMEAHLIVVGREPTNRETVAFLAPDRGDEPSRSDPWEVGQRIVMRGALQMVASRLVGQATQAAVGRNMLFEGVETLEKLRARKEPEDEILQKALDALDEAIAEDAEEEDDNEGGYLYDPGTFLVRERESGGFLGIFAAESAANLWDMVDEHDDPFGYEFLRVDNGGILFQKRPVLNPCPDDEDEAMTWEGPFPGHLITTDELMDRALVDSDADWERFDASDKGAGLIARVARRMKAEEGYRSAPASQSRGALRAREQGQGVKSRGMEGANRRSDRCRPTSGLGG